AVAGGAPGSYETFLAAAQDATCNAQEGGLSDGRESLEVKPARFLFDNPKQESRKSQGDSKDQARVADAQSSEILNPLLQGPFLAVVMLYAAPVIQDEIRAGRRDGLPREHIRFAIPADARRHENALRRLELNPHGEPVFRGVAGVHSNPERHPVTREGWLW